MRWDRLFADLEARFADLADEQAAAEQADRDRVATGAVTAAQRVAGAVGRRVRLAVAGGREHEGVLRRVGQDFLLTEDDYGRDVLVALAAVTSIAGLSSATAPAAADRPVRLDLRRALRSVARDRSMVAVSVIGAPTSSDGVGGNEIWGTIDRVGADFVEIAVHPVGEVRRAALVRGVTLVPLRAVTVVRALPNG